MADKPHITKDGYVAHLVRVGVWATPQNPIQYAFLEQKPAYLPNEQGWTPFSAAQRTAVQHAFAMIAEVVNLTFVQVADNQQIPGPTNPRINFYANSVNLNFSGSMDPYYAGGSDAIHGADIRLNNARIAQRQTNEGFQDFTSFVALHEVLHAMGLSHPGDYNGQGFNYQDHAEFVEDTIQYSVMSYWAAANAGADHVEGNVQYHARTPLLYDILALQSLYAPNMTTRAGDTVYGFNSNTGANSPFNFAAAAGPVVAIWDAGGIDTIDLSGYSSASLIDLNEGEFSDAGGLTKNIAIAFGVTIENAVGGAGNDKLTGNAAANRLEGGGGDDLLDGRGGADLLVGGAGNDLYLVDHAGDAAVEAAGGGTDEVRTALSAFALGANVEVLKGMSASGQVLTGNDEANVIEGGAGDDFIDGRGGADEMRGGQGFDIYIVDDPGDRVTEVSDYGLDEVRTNLASYALPADVEKLTGTSAGGQTLTGNGGANLITGAAGNDVIEGGAGPDELRGGAGNDLLTDAAGSTAAHGEGGNDRISIVQAAAGVLGDTYTLTGGDGDDEIRISVRGHVGVSIDAGSGDDRVVIASLDPEAQTRVTLGAGRDILTVKSEGANGLPYVDVADFAAGEAGDRIDLDALMAARLTNWNPGDNPFATGHLALVQAGADAVIQIDLDGGGDQLRELVRLENVHESTLVEANLGFAVPRTQGTSGNDRLSGTAAGEVFRLEQGGVDSASGRGGDDVFYFGGAFTTLDRVDGGDGTDEVVLQGDYFPPRHATMVLANVERLTLLSGGDDRFGGASAAAAGYTLDLPDTFLFSGGTLIVDASGLTASESLNFSGGVTSGGAFVLRGGAGGDTLIGGAGSDFIEAGGGDDHLNGMGGADLMRGGAGSDDYYLDHAGDVVEEADVAGVDTVHVALAAYALGPNVERLYGFATNGGQALTGNALANVILGTSGNDVLDGGAGADEMSGGDGNDVFIVDDHGDRAGDQQGVDEIHTHLAAYGLGDAWGIENLTGTSGSGQALTGNKFANRIAGGSGNDVIDGRAGADAMHGGAGDDLYFADDGGDVVVELPGGGNDEVRVSAASYALGENVETLVGTSNAGQVLSGNFQANIIRAGAGDDTIYAGGGNDALHGGAGRDGIYAGAGDDVIDGGAGPDYMVGQAGDDLYLVDDAGDEALEAANEGLDEVRTAISFALGAHVENLTGTGSSGQILTGNGGDN
ncbi:MAG TPA: M10 family metallopeptidase, partial [Allosphingosinicella sp.]